jgi:hypothetical protein
MPCTPAEALAVIFSSPRSFQNEETMRYLKEAYDDATEDAPSPVPPPLMEAIYLRDWNESGLQIVAGNRVDTHWTLHLSLSGSNPTTGRVEVDVPSGEHYPKWSGNIMTIVTDISIAVENVGGRTIEWPTTTSP